MSKPWRIPNSKPWITHDDSEAVAYVMGSIAAGEYTLGYEVAAFERELAEFLGRKYVVCVSSGTLALELATKAAPRCNWPVNAFGFIATANACPDVLEFVDDGGVGFTLCEVRPCNETDITDACQAFGAALPPSLADCYSFNWNKPITTLGGGCVATDDADLNWRVRAIANQGRWTEDQSGVCVVLGTNARMSDMQAALGRSQLRRVGDIMAKRKIIAEAWYPEHLPDTIAPADERDSWFLYPIELSNRDEVHAKMQERGIQTRSCADWMLPAHPYYANKYGYERGQFPEAERRADRTLLLPLYPEMTLEDVKTVCEALEECDARA